MVSFLGFWLGQGRAGKKRGVGRPVSGLSPVSSGFSWGTTLKTFIWKRPDFFKCKVLSGTASSEMNLMPIRKSTKVRGKSQWQSLKFEEL